MQLFLGSVFLLGGVYLLYRWLHLWLHGIRTTGTVTGYEEKKSRDGHSIYPIVEFYTQAGDAVSTRTQAGSSTYVFGLIKPVPAYRVGQQVPLVYSPTDPTFCSMDNYELWTMLLPALLLLAGGGWYLLGAL